MERHLFALLKQTYFMTMALGFVSVLARVFVIHQSFLDLLGKLLGSMGKNPTWCTTTPLIDGGLPTYVGYLILQFTFLTETFRSFKSMLKAIPNTPEHEEADDDFMIIEHNSVEALTGIGHFDPDLLQAFAAAEQDMDSDVDVACNQELSVAAQISCNPDPLLSEQKIVEEIEIPAPSSSRKEKKVRNLKSKKRKSRDELDDIFGDLS